MKGSVAHQVGRDRRQWIEDTPGSFLVDPLYELQAQFGGS